MLTKNSTFIGIASGIFIAIISIVCSIYSVVIFNEQDLNSLFDVKQVFDYCSDALASSSVDEPITTNLTSINPHNIKYHLIIFDRTSKLEKNFSTEEQNLVLNNLRNCLRESNGLTKECVNKLNINTILPIYTIFKSNSILDTYKNKLCCGIYYQENSDLKFIELDDNTDNSTLTLWHNYEEKNNDHIIKSIQEKPNEEVKTNFVKIIEGIDEALKAIDDNNEALITILSDFDHDYHAVQTNVLMDEISSLPTDKIGYINLVKINPLTNNDIKTIEDVLSYFFTTFNEKINLIDLSNEVDVNRFNNSFISGITPPSIPNENLNVSFPFQDKYYDEIPKAIIEFNNDEKTEYELSLSSPNPYFTDFSIYATSYNGNKKTDIQNLSVNNRKFKNFIDIEKQGQLELKFSNIFSINNNQKIYLDIYPHFKNTKIRYSIKATPKLHKKTAVILLYCYLFLITIIISYICIFLIDHLINDQKLERRNLSWMLIHLLSSTVFLIVVLYILKFPTILLWKTNSIGPNLFVIAIALIIILRNSYIYLKSRCSILTINEQ